MLKEEGGEGSPLREESNGLGKPGTIRQDPEKVSVCRKKLKN